ncbi:MAG TPA: PP2C family protein-serine/threonine phosphatase [Streptomyces sp.]|uniref:PP2C family protein-serine/threonine phosphatase n=1 Tax=Streptomyces sp. TaxID=1931 RepID=UPI002D421931|nr:PP2C family protein-serine/threonine phosphatase [Streptomyces sp.]HZG04437.1 PP2C family protein-serine/threonine phosphatase [Streptomyces sp.]
MRPLSAGSARIAASLWGRRWIWLLLPWLLVLGVTAVEIADSLGGHVFHAGPLLSPAPALAAIRGGPRDVLAVSAASLAIGLGNAVGHDWSGADNHTVVLASVAVMSAASLVASVARERREGQLVRLRRVAEVAQQAVLPPVPPRAGGLRLAAGYSAAESDTLVGGDLYEVVACRGRVRLIIGDVRGKGLPAIRTAAVVLGAFREAALYESALEVVASRCSRAVARAADDLGGEEGDELFVTAALVEIEGPVVRVLDLGHPPPLLLTSDGCRPLAVEPLPPLGLVHRFADHRGDGRGEWSVRTRWRPGDRLVLHTDGIDEARDGDGRFFPVVPHLEALRAAPTERLPELLLEAVVRYTGRGLRDDAAVLAVEFTGDRSPGNSGSPADVSPPGAGRAGPPEAVEECVEGM